MNYAWAQMFPPRFEGGGHNIKCPPSHDLGVGWLLIEMRTLFTRSPALWTFVVVVVCLSERFVMYDGYPFPVSGKLSQKCWGRGKKVSESPPPPPPLISFFRTCATWRKKRRQTPSPHQPFPAGPARLEAGGGPREKNPMCPPPPWSASDLCHWK